MKKKTLFMVLIPYVISLGLLLSLVYCFSEMHRIENRDVLTIVSQLAEEAGYTAEDGYDLINIQEREEAKLGALKEQAYELQRQCDEAEQAQLSEEDLIQTVVDEATKILNLELGGVPSTDRSSPTYNAHWERPRVYNTLSLKWEPIRRWTYADQVDGHGDTAAEFDFMWVCRDTETGRLCGLMKSHYNYVDGTWSDTTYTSLESPSFGGPQLYYKYGANR